MKTFLTLTAIALISISAYSQKIKVKESTENIGGANHSALVVNLYGINPSDAEDAFRSYMKTYDGKRSYKDGIFIDNATIKDMSDNTVDVYGKATGSKKDVDITFIVAFDLGGAFVSSDTKDKYKVAEKIVYDFAVQTTREAIEAQLKDAKKAQSKLEDAQKDLESENKDLNSDIENYKSKIKKAEDDIVKNKSDQDKKKAEIEAQKNVVETIDTKLKSVD
jgi:hypothetical protein